MYRNDLIIRRIQQEEEYSEYATAMLTIMVETLDLDLSDPSVKRKVCQCIVEMSDKADEFDGEPWT